jgi:hypothetical protein
MGSDHRLNVEGHVGGNEPSNAGEGFDREYRAINHRKKIRRGDCGMD